MRQSTFTSCLIFLNLAGNTLGIFNFSKIIGEQVKQFFKEIEVSSQIQQEFASNILPPRHMIELYQKYSQHTSSPDKEAFSVHCILGKVRKGSVKLNLSSLANNRVSHAEVHTFSRKPRHGKVSRIKFRVRMSGSRRKYLSSTVVWLMPTRGWQILDVTDLVQRVSGKGRYLKMSVEVPISAFGSEKESFHTFPLEEVLQTTFKPFLLVYMDDLMELPLFTKLAVQSSSFGMEEQSQCKNTFNHNGVKSTSLESQKEPDQIVNNLVSPLNKEKGTRLQQNGDKSSWSNKTEVPSNRDAQNLVDSFKPEDMSEGELRFMSKRSIQDNQLTPDYFETYHSPFNFVSPLHNRNISPSQTSDKNSYNEAEVQQEDEDNDDDYEYLLFPRFGKPKSLKKYTSPHSKKLSKARGEGKIPNNVKSTQYEALEPVEESAEYVQNKMSLDNSSQVMPLKACHLETKTINFDPNAIGKMFAPPNLVFSYCTGTCLQFADEDILALNRLPESETTTCCVPGEMRRFSVLYIDIHDNIVLRSYPNATVTDCKCTENLV